MKQNDLVKLKQIQEAFCKLLLANDFQKITIKQIMQEAKCNRTDFYSFYSGKEELAIDICRPILDVFSMYSISFLQSKSRKEQVANIVQAYQYIDKHQRLIQTLLQIQTATFSPYEMIVTAFKEECLKLIKKEPLANPIRTDYVTDILASELMETMVWWFNNRERHHNNYQLLANLIIEGVYSGIMSLLR